MAITISTDHPINTGTGCIEITAGQSVTFTPTCETVSLQQCSLVNPLPEYTLSTSSTGCVDGKITRVAAGANGASQGLCVSTIMSPADVIEEKFEWDSTSMPTAPNSFWFSVDYISPSSSATWDRFICQIQPDGTVYIYSFTLGILATLPAGTFQLGDVLTGERNLSASTVTYKVNGVTIFTSTGTITSAGVGTRMTLLINNQPNGDYIENVTLFFKYKDRIADAANNGYSTTGSSGTLSNGGTTTANCSLPTTLSGLLAGETATVTFKSVSDGACGAAAPSPICVHASAPVPVITPEVLPNGTVGTAYSNDICATLGIPPYTAWSVTSGSLPPGITLASTGSPCAALTGTPTAGGSYSFTVQVTDSNGQIDTEVFTIVIPADVTLTNTPANGTCWHNTETLHFSVDSGSITSIVSQTAGVTGTAGGLNTANATFALNYSNNPGSATIRVFTTATAYEDFTILLCPPLPPITNQSDAVGNSGDDAANLPPASVYQCEQILVDILGPTFLSGDVTWTVLNSANVPVTGAVVSGQNSPSATLNLNSTVAPGTYTIKACETDYPTNCQTHTFQLLALPPITVGTPNKPYVGSSTQFVTAYPGAKTWGIAGAATSEINASTGLATWVTSGIIPVTYTTASGCVVTLNYEVYPDVEIEEYDPLVDTCLYINAGQQLQLTVTGGSGNYKYQITGSNEISQTGLITAGSYSGEYTVTVIDDQAGIIKTVPLCIGSQSQFCVEIEKEDCGLNEDHCCEILVECGESIQLKVPSFHVRCDGVVHPVAYSSSVNGTTGEGGYFRSGTGQADATANAVDCSGDCIFEVVTNRDMADVANCETAIGFADDKNTTGLASQDVSVVWFTDASGKYIEVRHKGVSEAGSKVSINEGDVVSGGFLNGNFVVYVNNLLVFTSTVSVQCCGDKYLKVTICEANKVVGGDLFGTNWVVTTPGTPQEVGFIDPQGRYIAPTTGYHGAVTAQATVGNATFNVNIRNVKPTPNVSSPNAYLLGRDVTIWVGPYIPNFNEVIRLAKDGSPDALQNPNMVSLGVLAGSANFQEQIDYQDFTNDRGLIDRKPSSESAELSGQFQEVRDLKKLELLMTNSTLFPKRNGATVLGVGGKLCGLGELRVIVVIGRPDCDGETDIIYLPRVQNTGNLGLNIGRSEIGQYDFTLTALPDYTLPAGRQLYSIIQRANCSNDVCEV